MSNSITVILNSFKRPQYLQEQIESINNQILKPKEILIWNNNPDQTIVYPNITVSNSNKNLGVWSRFAYALNAKTEYVCIFDDDTIPGSLWLENCYNTIQTHEGLLGTIGLVFDSDKSYYPHIRYGWDGNIEKAIRVDIVGHSWFFKREWLPYFWMESPTEGFDLVGEDMHFSYTIQKYLGLNTFVPPHPANNPNLWGSIKAVEYGCSREAVSYTMTNLNKMVEYYKILISKGFKIINQ